MAKAVPHGFSELYIIYYLHNNEIDIAPSEAYRLLGIFKDKSSKEMSFPMLFYGKKRANKVTKKFTYHYIVQWEVLRQDHVFAYHTTNMFYKVV